MGTADRIRRGYIAMRRTAAFTLIELLVVISIIALLMAVLVPALMRAKENGKKMVCAGNVRTLGMANIQYAEDEDGWYVAFFDRLHGEHPWPANKLFRKLVGYRSRETTDTEWNAPREFLCPSDRFSIRQKWDQYRTYLSYAGNVTDWYYSDDWYGIKYAGHKTTSVPMPSTKMVFTESNDWWAYWPGANYVTGWDVLGDDGIRPYKLAGLGGPTLYRHGNGVNLGFYDGHNEYMKKEKVWNQEAFDAGTPGMWSVLRHWPPNPEDLSRLPKP
jgi:prepilin-type N-terminal cleavage/methylation domain-containing protein/prepilin-type processing-associated H-X9-DG protein